jgi:hypothetical protein
MMPVLRSSPHFRRLKFMGRAFLAPCRGRQAFLPKKARPENRLQAALILERIWRIKNILFILKNRRH